MGVNFHSPDVLVDYPPLPADFYCYALSALRFAATNHVLRTTDGIAFSGDAVNPSTGKAISVIKRPEVPSSLVGLPDFKSGVGQ